MVERGGTTLLQMLARSDPWAGAHCGRNCFPCSTALKDSDMGKCNREGVCYTLTCNTCQANNKLALYTGESGRSGQERGLDHDTALVQRDEEHPGVKHMVEAHLGDMQEPRFTMRITGNFRSALTRQVTEATAISQAAPDYNLNGRGEWNVSHLPRMVLDTEVASDDLKKEPKRPKRDRCRGDLTWDEWRALYSAGGHNNNPGPDTATSKRMRLDPPHPTPGPTRQELPPAPQPPPLGQAEGTKEPGPTSGPPEHKVPLSAPGGPPKGPQTPRPPAPQALTRPKGDRKRGRGTNGGINEDTKQRNIRDMMEAMRAKKKKAKDMEGEEVVELGQSPTEAPVASRRPPLDPPPGAPPCPTGKAGPLTTPRVEISRQKPPTPAPGRADNAPPGAHPRLSRIRRPSDPPPPPQAAQYKA